MMKASVLIGALLMHQSACLVTDGRFNKGMLFGKRTAAAVVASSRRDALLSIGTIPLSFLLVRPTASIADPRSTILLHLDNPNERAGLELVEVNIGSPNPRTAVAVKGVLPGGAAARAGVQPGLVLLDAPNAKSVVERIRDGPYPMDLTFYNLAAGGDAFGDQGKPLVSAEDALQMAKSTSGGAGGAVAPSSSSSSADYVMRTLKEAPSSCRIKSRRGDVLEIRYEARYGSAANGVVYDSSSQRGTGTPYMFVLGSGDMIPGVDRGLYDMCPGETRQLEIPPVLGYGTRARALFDIPSGSRLYWNVTLVTVNSVREGDDRTRDEIEGRAL